LTFERILIPLDGSETAASILPAASDLAKRLQARVDLLAVVDPETTELPSYVPTAIGVPAGYDSAPDLYERSEEIQLERTKTANEYLASIAADLRADGIEADTEAMVGDPAFEIVTAAQRKHLDLVAMATRGRSTIGRGLLGSVTDKVIHSSAIPMLILKPGDEAPDAPITEIIVGLDGSRVAESALDPARDLGVSLDIEIILLRATAVAARLAAYGGEPYFASTDLYGDSETEAQDYLDNVAERQSAFGANVSTRVGTGAAVNEIQLAISQSPGALMVLATRGRSGLTRWVLGSVTDRVIRSSQNPVLVIPPNVGGWR
jgi:nucleotide-binding universal stress UspA family protein